ncbi:response regulator transcription factor [Cryptosporangium japonicum]|uniref:Response regulator transcription factor n=1 Tax=Cryptosporangium japonicum TaxID=80872 RepID=A0ABP3EJM7_9ACTN
MTIRIVVADDQEAIRAAFRIILDAQPDMTVVGEAADGVSAVDQARHLRPDVLLADIRMPGLDGLEVTRRLGTETRVVIVTTFDLDEYVHAALRSGACGFILKRSSPTLLTEAVRAAVSGDVLLSPQLTTRLLKQFAPAAPVTPAEPLTRREIDVARLVAEGMTNSQIADVLALAPGTVKNHVATIQRKVGAANRVGIAAWFWQPTLPEP